MARAMCQPRMRRCRYPVVGDCTCAHAQGLSVAASDQPLAAYKPCLDCKNTVFRGFVLRKVCAGAADVIDRFDLVCDSISS